MHFLFFIVNIHFLICQITEITFDGFDTTTFKHFFIRKINEEEIYIGNGEKDGVYNLKTKEFTNIITDSNKISQCGFGILYPLFIFENSENNNLKYILSYNSSYYYMLDYQNGNNRLETEVNIPNTNFGIKQINENNFFVATKIENKKSESGLITFSDNKLTYNKYTSYNNFYKFGIEISGNKIINFVYNYRNYDIYIFEWDKFDDILTNVDSSYQSSYSLEYYQIMKLII